MRQIVEGSGEAGVQLSAHTHSHAVLHTVRQAAHLDPHSRDTVMTYVSNQ